MSRRQCSCPVPLPSQQADGQYYCYRCALQVRKAGSPQEHSCGYFDNGYDTEHEHRVNCRRCLLERIALLTKALTEQGES